MGNIIELTEINVNYATTEIEYQKTIIDLRKVTFFYQMWLSGVYFRSKDTECTCVYIGDSNIVINEKFETLLNAVEKNGKLSKWVEFEMRKGQRLFIRKKGIKKVEELDGKTFVTFRNWHSTYIEETLEDAKKKLKVLERSEQ